MILEELQGAVTPYKGTNKYLFAALIFIAFFIFAKIGIYVIEKLLMGLAKRTKTDIDDKILIVINTPISLIIVLLGIQISLRMIELSKTYMSILLMIINSVIIIVLAYVATKITYIVIHGWGMNLANSSRSKVDVQLVKLANNFAMVLIWIVAIIFMLQSWGFEIGPLLASLGIAGIAVAFALQNTLSNIFGGVSLIMDKSLKVNDVIELDDNTSGRVLDVGIRSTKIRTWNNEVLIIPNGKLADARILNYVQPDRKIRVVVPFSVEYGSDISKVKKIVLAEVKKVKHFIDDPAPWIWFREMGDSGLLLRAHFYIESYEHRFHANDEATQRIYEALNKNRITIPFPQMDVHMKK